MHKDKSQSWEHVPERVESTLSSSTVHHVRRVRDKNYGEDR